MAWRHHTGGDTIHVWPDHGRGHDLSNADGPPGALGPHPCWCSPQVEDFRPEGGRVLVTHREVN